MTNDTVSPEFLVEYNQESLREKKDTDISSLKITVSNSGIVSLIWSENETIVEKVEFCFNAFSKIVSEIPYWFEKINEPFFYTSCSLPSGLVCMHDEEFPEIVLGVINETSNDRVAMVILDRGMVLSIFDEILDYLSDIVEPKTCETSEIESDLEEVETFQRK